MRKRPESVSPITVRSVAVLVPGSGACARGPNRPLSEVERRDVIVAQGGDEALDLGGHVVVGELLDVLDQGVRALVEQRVVALDVRLAVHAGRFPLALGAAALDLPTAGRELVPGERVDELAVALGTQFERGGYQILVARRGCAGRALEVDDLHSLAAGEDDSLDLEIAHAQAVIGPDQRFLEGPNPLSRW